MISDYTRLINFTAKAGLDALPSDFDDEFNRVAASSALKAPLLNPTFTGVVTVPALANATSDAGIIGKNSPARSGEIYMNTFETGVKTLFYQATAPLGWTQDTKHDDTLLRVVSGAGGGKGGNKGFVANPLDVTGNHKLTVAEIPAHTHDIGFKQFSSSGYAAGASMVTTGVQNTKSTGGGGNHSHPITFNPKYIDLIVCTKD